MGSTGTGRFTDYPGTSRGSKSTAGMAKGSGASGGQDLCERALQDVPLQEVAICDYFKSHESLPAVGTPAQVRTRIVKGRIGVELSDTHELLGLLPTEFNYIRGCVEKGYSYAGQVSSARTKPIPVVRVKLEPRE